MRVRTVDLRHAMGAILTLSMFAMLANMIKHDHFDYVEVKLPAVSQVEYNILTIRQETSSVINFTKANNGLLSEKIPDLKPCWKIPAPKERQQPKGYIVFSLTNDPEYQMAQVGNAVVVAKYLRAILVLPDIRGRKPEERRNFSEIYDDHKFVDSLKGIVEVSPTQPAGAYAGYTPVVRVPTTVSEAYIEAHIKPLFHKKGILRIWTYFPSINTKKNEATKVLDPTTCLAMFGTLQPQPHIRRIVDGILWRMRNFTGGPNGKIIAIDLRDGALQSKSCQQLGDGKVNRCDVKEIAEFLREAGFGPESSVYLTHSRWHHELDPLKDLFPRTYTKDLLISQIQKQKLHGMQDPEVEKVIDFIMCSESHVFVPVIKNQFFTSVVGARTASRQMQSFAPAKISSFSASASDYISPYLSKKTNPAYSCLC